MTFNDQSLYSPQFSTHYIQYTLYDLAEWINGMSFKQSMFSERGVPVIKIAEVKNGITQQTKYSDADHDLKYLLKDDDYLFCWSGQPETSIDTFKWNSGAGWLNQHIYKVLPRENIINAEYFYYLMKYLKPTFIKLASNKQTTGLGHVTKKDLQEIQVAIPEQTKQSAITNILKNIDKKIKLLEETNKTLESIAQAIFKSWFVDFDPVHAKQQGIECAGIDKTTADLFPNSFVESELGLIPKGWKVGKVNELGEVICGKTPSTIDKENFDGNIPFITIPDMHNNIAITSTNRYLSKKGADSQHKKYLRKGSVCISCIATPGLVSKVTVDSQSNQQINSVIPDSKWGDDFVLFLLRRIGDAVKMAGSGGSIFHNLNTSNFREIKIILPSSQISNVFNELASVYMEKIISNQYQIKTLIALRDTLLPRLISGKLDLSNIEEELEGVA